MSDENLLTLQAKEAIRRYVLSLLVIPSSILAVLGFVLGFAIRDHASSNAYSKALSMAFPQQLKMLESQMEAADRLSKRIDEISRDLSDKTKHIADRLASQSDRIDTRFSELGKSLDAAEEQAKLHLSKILASDINALSDSLKNDPEFKKDVAAEAERLAGAVRSAREGFFRLTRILQEKKIITVPERNEAREFYDGKK